MGLPVDAFDEIISNQPEEPEGNDGDDKLEHIWDAIEHVWPHFYEGILVKGMVLAEYVDPEGARILRFVSSPDVTPWEMLGMLESARLDAQDVSRSCNVFVDTGGDDDDDDED
jgi:hypothetical protein